MRQWITLGILTFLFGAGSANGQGSRFVSERAFQENLARQVAMSPETVTQLRQYGVTSESKLKLEYFFYTNTQVKAQSLAEALSEKGYSVEVGPSAGDPALFLVTGWTVLIQMDTEFVVFWTETMVRLGYAYDSEFDGWGTNPNQ